jgi:hypothetical protein
MQFLPQIESDAKSAETSSNERDLLNKEAVVYLDEAQENFEVMYYLFLLVYTIKSFFIFQELSQMISRLKDAIKQLEKKNAELSKFNPLYEREYVIPAKKHAEKLLRQAKDFNK